MRLGNPLIPVGLGHVDDHVETHLRTGGADVGDIDLVKPLLVPLSLPDAIGRRGLEGAQRRHDAGHAVLGLIELGRHQRLVAMNQVVGKPGDDDRILQPLALVHGQNAHGVGTGQDPDGLLVSLAVPMRQEPRPAEILGSALLRQFEGLGVGGVLHIDVEGAQDAADALSERKRRPGGAASKPGTASLRTEGPSSFP